ncbi:zinc finger protein 43-like isoform X2 [Hyla sarda]|uniref:zinc finger protein 43-like isoform X2 n=1 Tax=Hyla sarda TaxID=327740 RepID=UPI0024C39EE7|nr:zinc finger protein 43-like isoform X2 [Hyla sarda]
MPRSKEICDDVRKKIVEAHEAGKGYKTISKVFDVHRSTVISIIYKWRMFKTTATRPRSGRPTKLDIIVRKVRRSGAGTRNGKVTTEDERAQEEKSERITGRPNVHTRAEDDEILRSTNPLPHNDQAVTTAMPKRTRGHKEKTKESGLMGNCVWGSVEHPEALILCCEICGACFPTEPDLESHQAQHLDKTQHECEECGKSFQSAAGLKTHKRRKHGR